MNLERLRKIIAYSEKNHEDIYSMVNRFCAFARIEYDSDNKLFERRSSSNYSRGSYQASSWRPVPPLLCKIAKWKTVGLIFETKIRYCRKKNTDRLELFCG